MPVHLLGPEPVFPSPELAREDGLLALGGDLEPERILNAYRNGIFPWYSGKRPILWWSPDPRCVIFPDKVKVSGSLRRVMKAGRFEIAFDRNFPAVIRKCATVRRKGPKGTWITRDMEKAYTRLHEMGVAHSVEAWSDGELAGGLYGLSMGRVFFGESMFSEAADASKAALVTLCRTFAAAGGTLIDCQMETPHLLSLGAETISRTCYLGLLTGRLEGEPGAMPWGTGEGEG